jgi:hypothetical protein
MRAKSNVSQLMDSGATTLYIWLEMGAVMEHIGTASWHTYVKVEARPAVRPSTILMSQPFMIVFIRADCQANSVNALQHNVIIYVSSGQPPA